MRWNIRKSDKPTQAQLPKHRHPARDLRCLAPLIFISLVVIVAVSWIESGIHVNRQVNEAISAAREDAQHDASDIGLGLQRNLALLHGIPSTFAKNKQVSDALQVHAPSIQKPTFIALNKYLDGAVKDLNVVSTIWIMDLQGNCIAASNFNSELSFVGTNYAARDYFKMSMKGLNGNQFAVGKITGVPGLFFAAPVWHKEAIVGVVAIKVDLPFLSLWLSQANTLVTDEFGVVILATDRSHILHTFDMEAIKEISLENSTQRYRLTNVPAVEIVKKASGGNTDMLLVGKQSTPVIHMQIAIPDESKLLVHVLAPVPYALRMGSDRIIRFALESGFGVMALLLLCIVALYVRFIQNAHAVLSVHKLRLDEAQRLARVGSWELDLTSGQMKWSAQIYRIFHMEPTTNNPTLEEFLGQIQEADKSAVRKIMEGGSDLKEHVECSVGILRMTGDSGRVRLKLEEVTGQTGLVEGLIGTLSDITEQELLESELRRAKIEAESASRLKSDFIANISHELKTPMNSILGRSQIALQGDLGSTAKIHIQTVHKSAEHLLSIINEILDFSKLEANKYVVEKRGFSLLEVTRKLQDQLLPLAREKDLKFQMDTPSNLPTRLVGDPEQLGKVLSALATNSIKFTQEGRVSMGIETGLQTGTAIELHFWVNDTGIGMTPGQQANLFQAFSQVDSSRTRKFGGTGLGLVISKRIVEMMGGRIWIQSIFGTGTTVHVVIPFEKVAQSKVAASLVSVARPVAEQRSHANLSDTQVLLVEDSSINQELAKRLLAKFDVAVTLATNGQEALDILSTKIDFDAILMDCHMPVMDGYTATREVRKINALNGIPVIALTANVSANDRAKMSASGMCDVVAKPYTAQELIDVLFRWVAPKNRTTQRSSDREAQPSTADFMPPVPGINVPYGLNIAMSDVNLYKRLLQMFGQSEVNFAQKFKSARQSGDGASATRLAHSLKGVSGSIGAKDVQAAALSLESACHKGLSDADIRPLLDTTLEALKQVLDGLGVLNEPCADSDAPLWDSMRVNILVVHLEELIAQQDLCVYDIVEDLALATNGSSISTAVNKVVKAIERFDLVLAQQELKHVSVALKGL